MDLSSIRDAVFSIVVGARAVPHELGTIDIGDGAVVEQESGPGCDVGAVEGLADVDEDPVDDVGWEGGDGFGASIIPGVDVEGLVGG